MKNLQKELKPILESEYSKIWRRRDGSIATDMVEYCIKEYLHIEYQGKLIEVCEAKPSIQNQFWFDDEGEIPNATYALFKRKNLERLSEHFKKNKYQEEELLLLRKGKSNIYSVGYMNPNFIEGEYESVSDKLLEKLNQVITYRNSDYKKRLENYWKRYSDKVRCSGYWVNR